MKYYGITDVGKVRKENQDTFVCEELPIEGSGLAAVCDGMGGASGGSIASAMACEAFKNYIFEKFDLFCADTMVAQLVQDASVHANKVVFEKGREDVTLRGMGTTLVGALIIGDYAIIINIGDSRVYLLSKEEGIRQITRDHSVVEDMVSRGSLTREEAKLHPNKNLITRAIGTSADCTGDVYKVKLEDDDRVLLCSDGLSNLMEDERLYEYAMKFDDLKQSCEALINASLEAGAPDNVTAVLLSK